MPIRPASCAEHGDVSSFLPYGRQLIEEDDIAAVVAVLKGDLLTTGPAVQRFEHRLAETVGARETVACSNGTAALYMAAGALGLGPGRVAIVPAMTFLATASAPHLLGAEIVFSDVDPETGLMRSRDLEDALSRAPGGRADVVIPVHYAGQSCDMGAIAKIARAAGMGIIEDAAHALGSQSRSQDGAQVPVGANVFADLTTFSFHPVKAIAMGEGGAVSANDPELLRRLRLARNHGITRAPEDYVRRDAAFDADGTANPWYYELQAPGLKFHVPDINCALGLSQLGKLSRFVAIRRSLVAAYDKLLAPLAPYIAPINRDARSETAWHIYPVRIDFDHFGLERATLMRALTNDGIGTQVHYVPVHQQPYYTARYGRIELPGAENYYSRTLSLPLHAVMTETDVSRVVNSLKQQLGI